MELTTNLNKNTEEIEAMLALIHENRDPHFAHDLLGALENRHPGLVKLWASLNGKCETTEAETVRFRSMNHFLEEVGNPPQMLIEGHLPDKSLFILAGKPKHCKSFVALSVALEIARHQRAFGQYEISRSGSVVYLAMEDGEFEVANRLLKHRLPGEDLPLHLCTEGFRMATTEAVEALAERIRPLNPVLLVIDTATEALGIRRWEDRGEVSQKLRPLRELIARQLCSVLLVAHNRKADGESGDEIAGSNAFTGAVDGWWSIHKKEVQPNGNVLLHYRREGRGGVRGEGVLEMDTHSLKVAALDAGAVNERRAEVAPNKAAQAKTLILELLSDGQAWKTDTIFEALKAEDIGIVAAREALRSLKKEEIKATRKGNDVYYRKWSDDDACFSGKAGHHHSTSPGEAEPLGLRLVTPDTEPELFENEFQCEDRNHNLDAFR